jgi:5-formyltetrahydrofolate cyclo-ligase
VAISRLPLFARRFALYAASDGEVDTRDLVDRLLERGRQVALPVVLPDRLLAFYRYSPKTRLVRNRYGILEPDTRTTPSISARTLDVVFLPLVAFDANGHRLGMGGGFYDATFGRVLRRPVLIGLAHSLQRIDDLDAEDWDIPLDAVVTERGIIAFTPRGRRATRH